MAYGHGFNLLALEHSKREASGEERASSAELIAPFKELFSDFPKIAAAETIEDVLEAMIAVSAKLYIKGMTSGDEASMERGERAATMHHELVAKLNGVGSAVVDACERELVTV